MGALAQFALTVSSRTSISIYGRSVSVSVCVRVPTVSIRMFVQVREWVLEVPLIASACLGLRSRAAPSDKCHSGRRRRRRARKAVSGELDFSPILYVLPTPQNSKRTCVYLCVCVCVSAIKRTLRQRRGEFN